MRAAIAQFILDLYPQLSDSLDNEDPFFGIVKRFFGEITQHHAFTFNEPITNAILKFSGTLRNMRTGSGIGPEISDP